MKLFEPIQISCVTLRNRLVMPPMTTNLARNGKIGEEIIAYYEARAKGGVGLIEVEPGTVEYPRGNLLMTNIAVDEDHCLPGLKKLADAVHAHGAKISMQLAHGGRRAGRVSSTTGCMEITRGLMPVGPSPIAHPVTGHVVPKELTEGEIEDLVERFAQAAGRLAAAGFDFVTLHFAHMYLCGQFLSPWANQRTDQYGGNLDGRLRFPLEIIESIREIGRCDLPIICRLNGDEPPGGNSREEILEIARRLQEAGVASLHISTGFGIPIKAQGFIPSVTPMRTPDNCIVHLAADIKRVVSLPVIAVNKIKDIQSAEEILQKGQADLIAMGRPLLADPDLPMKAFRNEIEDIRPCIYCCQGCAQNAVEKGVAIACTVNPRAGRESKVGPVEPASEKKKVLVVGAGPAGMQAAVTAAERGHQVWLVDKGKVAGGQLLIASQPPGKKEIDRLTRYLSAKIQRSKVVIRWGEEISAEIVDQIKPDAIIVATGSRPIIPEVEGLSSRQVLTARQVLLGDEVRGGHVLVIGGGTVGCEVAEFLAVRGKKVTVVEALDETACGMPQVAKISLDFALEEHGVRVMLRSKVLAVKEDGAEVQHGRRREKIPMDAIVLAVGSEPSVATKAFIKDKTIVVYEVGDQANPRGILEAIREGFDTARQI